MIGVPVAPRRVFGVALSAGVDCGRRTWVCRAHPGSGGIRVESVERLVRLPGGAREPVAACRSLVGKVLEAPRSAWGFDFAFGLAHPDLPDTNGISPGLVRWREAAAGMAEPGARAQLVERVGGRPRRTDRERDLPGPLSAERRENTELGLGQILVPLHGQAGIAILPIDPLPMIVDGMPAAMRARAANIYLLEVAPGRLLERVRASSGDGDTPERRLEWLRSMVAEGWVRPMARALRGHVCAEPGGLASVAAAVAAWRGYREYDHGALCQDPEYGCEGHVYC